MRILGLGTQCHWGILPWVQGRKARTERWFMLVIIVRVASWSISSHVLNACAAVAGRRTPAVIVVKCGTEAEAASDKKPGNRGKRDSQLILMNFFSRVTYNDRMTPLDFDLF